MSVAPAKIGRSIRVAKWLRRSRHLISDDQVTRFCRDFFGQTFDSNQRVWVVMIDELLCFVCHRNLPRLLGLQNVSRPSHKTLRDHFRAHFPGIRLPHRRTRADKVKAGKAKPNHDGLLIKGLRRDSRSAAVHSKRSYRTGPKSRRAPRRRGLPFHHRRRQVMS